MTLGDFFWKKREVGGGWGAVNGEINEICLFFQGRNQAELTLQERNPRGRGSREEKPYIQPDVRSCDF